MRKKPENHYVRIFDLPEVVAEVNFCFSFSQGNRCARDEHKHGAMTYDPENDL